MHTNEHITVLGDDGELGTPWDPRLGEEAVAAGERARLDDLDRQDVMHTSVRILSQCLSPNVGIGSRTGLVVGYVQSGKTLSFTTVAALANDNGFGIIVVIAGMTNELSQQSHTRLLRDLGVEKPFSRWAEFFEPDVDDVGRIRDVLVEAREDSLPVDERRTVLITLKKNHVHLRNLIDVFAELGEAAHVPALVIDDEADQASLNNLVRKGDLSSTYRRLRELRKLLPLHTFLQYTATPQAPILINLIDVLSPDFAIVLDPGPDYVGGRDFFTSQSPHVGDIPPDEIPTRDNTVLEPPDSLLRALRLFFVGVASGEIRRDGQPRNRSMMVHPARETVSHVQYHVWVQAVRNLWMETLSLPSDDPDRQDLLKLFRDSHAEISYTVGDLESFDDITDRLLRAIRRTDVRLINSLAEANRDIHWSRNYSWILVGGQVLDRGFTVEGLTVTYMPRGPGVGNADTIQQRARFLGYKRQYLGYCRVFLEPSVSHLYRAYVRHEEDMRDRLMAHIRSSRPLSEFRRVFLLAREFRPTRQSVIDIDYTRPTFRSGWCVPNQPQEADLEANRAIVDGFLERHAQNFVPDEGHAERQAHQRHRVARGVPLNVVYNELLTRLEIDIQDSEAWTLALILIDRYAADNPGCVCTVFHMRPDVLTRRLVRDGRIVELFQGAYPVETRDVYRGDRELRDAPVTVQLHTVTLRTEDQQIVAKDVKFAAIWMASPVCQDLIVQPQSTG